MIRFPLATSSWDEAEQAALQRVIASDRYSMGAEVAAFEADFARFTGSRYAVMVNSGSSANLAMVAALRYTQNPDLRLMPGDEVIVPAVSWSTTFFPLVCQNCAIKRQFFSAAKPVELNTNDKKSNARTNHLDTH